VRGGLLQWALRPREAESDLAAAWTQLAGGSDPGQRVQIANQLMRVRHALGDLPGAAAVAQSLLDEAAQLQLGTVFQCDVMHVLAMVEMASGRPADALARFDTVLARLHAAGEPVPDAFACALALLHIALGRHAEALRWLEERHPARGQHGFLLPDIAWALTRVKLARAKGEDPAPWLAQVPALDPLPPALQLQCTVALATLRPHAALAELQALALRLDALGLRGPRRAVLVAAVRAAQLEGQPEAACAQAQQALAVVDHVDGWLDEPASVWLAATRAFEAAGRHDEARRAAQTGAAWVQARVGLWSRPEDRAAWIEGNPVHRQLLTLAS
jgi:tetratricopeptide (TPR) repeat protein